MWVITDDPARDFEDFDYETHKNDHLYPLCDICKEPILEGDEYVEIDDMTMHYECTDEWVKKQRKVMEERVWQELLG